MTVALALFLTVLHVFSANAVSQFQYHDCTPADSPMHISYLDISPNPLLLPGTARITIDGYTNGTVSHSTVHIGLKKKHALFGLDIPIPCINHLGTCDYDDICTIIDDMEKEHWGYGMLSDMATQLKTMLSAHKTNARCPFTSGHLQLTNYTVALPPVPPQLSGFADGDYYGEISIKDKATGKTIFCFNADVHLKQAPTVSAGPVGR